MDENKDRSGQEEKKICFVIMPIGSEEKYTHFLEVYETIFKPAIENAGFIPYRADENMESNIIHVDIIEKIFDAPMVLCDITGGNPNVLYELGLRHSVDNKPVVVVQAKEDERKIFDIGLINTFHYSQEMKFKNVLEDIELIKKAIEETYKSNRPSSLVISAIKRNRLEKNKMEVLQNHMISEQVAVKIQQSLDEMHENDNRDKTNESIAKLNIKMANIMQALRNPSNYHISVRERNELLYTASCTYNELLENSHLISIDQIVKFKMKLEEYKDKCKQYS